MSCPPPLHTLPIRLVLLALLLLAACSGSVPSLQPLATDARVLAFGNSLTHGTGAGDGESYPDVLARLIDREVINAGIPGEVSAEGRERLAGVLDEIRPDLLILCHGGNDILRDHDLERTRENLAAMVAMAQTRDIQVVLIGVPELSLFSGVANFYQEVAEAHDIPLDDGIVRGILGDSDLRADRIHPNAQGYRIMAERIHDLLAEAGAVAPR